MKFLLIALGAFFGGVSRYAIDSLTADVLEIASLGGTLIVNLLGAFAIGYAHTHAARASSRKKEIINYGMITGFCGGFTTFSAFSAQIVQLIRVGEGTLAGAYAFGSLFLGAFSVYLGIVCAIRRQRASQ